MRASVRERPSSGKSDDFGIEALQTLARRIPLPVADAQVWFFPLDLDTDCLHQCSRLLSGDENDRAKRFRRSRDRSRYLAGRGLLRVLLGKHLGVSPSALDLAADALGKPHLRNRPEPVCFNLSHAEDGAVLAISGTCEVGVDIESLAREVDGDALARRFFSAREHADYQRLPQAARRRAFLQCWTRKEAVAKALGQGLRIPLGEIEVSVSAVAAPEVLRVGADSGAHWTLYEVDAGAGFVATLALRRLAA